MKQALLVGILSIFLTPVLSPAANDVGSCYGRDFREQMGPVRNQGNMGWCYANASADLLGYFLKVQTTTPISAVQLALLYNYHWQDTSLFEGGSIKQTLDVALATPMSTSEVIGRLDRGYCPQSLEDLAVHSGVELPLKRKLTDLMTLKMMYDNGRNNPLKRQEFVNELAKYAGEGSILGKLDQTKLYEVFENSSSTDFFLLFSDLVCGNSRVYNYNQNIRVVHRNAEQIMTHVPPQGPSYQETVKNDLIKEIDETLNRYNIVGIDYNSGFLESSAFPYVKGDLHASIVVGRKWENGQCQYLVRNSWGPACTRLDLNDLNNRVKPRYSKYIEKCEAGNVWIQEKHLRANLDSITYMSNP